MERTVIDPLDQKAASGGIANLLDHCVGLKPGQKLLVVTEPAEESFYRDELGALTAQEARRRGAEVKLVTHPPVAGPEDFPRVVLDEIAVSDHTIFFSRLGIQARFRDLPGPGQKVVAYTLDGPALAASFGSLSYGFLQDLHQAVVGELAKARSYRIQCDLGTDLRMELNPDDLAAEPLLTPFAVRNFSPS